MASFINTNTASLNAQRNLTTSQASLSTSLQRLSSGLRINSAKDDAAGLAISSRLSSQIRGVDQAARNANDGISLAQTAESALGSTGDNLQRIRELAVQSSNATNSPSDRASIQKEVTQLKSEIDRVAQQTSFNGTALLDGTFSGAAFQVGADSGQTITVSSITNGKTSALGATSFADNTTYSASTAASTGLSINGVAITDVSAGSTAAAQGTAVANAINAQYDATGVYASVNSSTGAVSLASTKAGASITIAQTTGGFTAGTTAAATSLTAANIDVSTFTGSQRALGVADASLTAVNNGRADLGAIQNRFSTAVTNLQATSENLSAARSRIQDTDFAHETASLTRGQILQQAGTAILAQANSLPNGVLALLRG